jgi:hypothetical protein
VFTRRATVVRANYISAAISFNDRPAARNARNLVAVRDDARAAADASQACAPAETWGDALRQSDANHRPPYQRQLN